MVELAQLGSPVDLTEFNTPEPDQGVGVFGALGASFRQNTTVGAIMSREHAAGIWDDALPVGEYLDNAFTEAEIAALPSVYAPYQDRFVGLTKDGARAMRANIDRELADRATLDKLGMIAGFGADLAVQLLDPVNYVPVAGTTLKGASFGQKLYRGAKAGLAGAALQEPVLWAAQETRTAEEVKANLLSSVAFGAVFGGAAHIWEMGKARWGEPKPARAAASGVDVTPLREEVHAHIKGQLEALGYEPDAAAVNADVFAQAYAVAANRSGVDAKALAEAYKVRVTADAGAGPEALAQSVVNRGGRAASVQRNGDVALLPVEIAPVALDRAGARAAAMADRGSVKMADGVMVDITKAGPSKMFSGVVSDAKAALAPRLKDVLANAVTYAEADGFRYAAARVNYDGKEVALRVVLKEEAGRVKLYQVEGFEVPRPALPSPDGGAVVALGAGGTPGGTVADLVKVFNAQDGQGRGFMQGPDKPLYVVHNLSAEKLRHAVDLGGLAAPSLAVARGDIGFNDFGEISLIGDPSLADPKGKGVRAFNADVYSARQPRARFKVNGKAADGVVKAIRPVAEKLGLEWRGDFDFEREGLSALSGDMAVKAAWLDSLGEEVPIIREMPDAPEPVAGFGSFKSETATELLTNPDFERKVWRKYELLIAKYEAGDPKLDRIKAIWMDEAGALRDDILVRWASDVAARNREISAFARKPKGEGRVARYLTSVEIDKRIEGRADQFNAWLQDRFGSVIGDAFFMSGAGRKMDYTLSNLVREMTKAVRNGENWTYGAGNVRAAVAPEFKSLAEIKGARGQIVDSADMEAVKNEVNGELLALADKFAPLHREGDRFGWGDTFAEFLRDMTRGPRAVAEWMPSFKVKPSDELMAEAGAFLEKLKGLPTNYFEIKMQRAVGLGEFRAALIPSSASPETRKALSDAGLDLIEYQPGEGAKASRNAALQSLSGKVFFQQTGAEPRGSIEFTPGGPLHGQAVIRLLGGADASTFMHESAHFFLEVMDDLHKAGGDKSAFADDIAVIEKWAGGRGEDGRFTREAHERFARGFEHYLRSGEAPSPALRRAFEAFKEWLVALYASAARLNVDVSPEMVAVYDRLLVPDVSEMPGAYPRSVGAAAVGEAAMVDPETGEYRAMTASDFALRNRFARGVEASGVGLTPNNRAARSKLVGVKSLMAKMVEDQRDTEASRQGAVGAALETLIKNDRGLVQAKLYRIFGKDGKRIAHPTMGQAEFEERIINALANPDSEGDSLVRATADRVQTEVIAPLKAEMRRIGMLAERQGWKQDRRYAPHNWVAGKILADLPNFRRKMGQRIAAALGDGYKIEIDKAEKRKTNLLREIDALERGGLRRRDDLARRFNGEEINLTEPEIRQLIMQSRNKPDEKRPQSLRQFVVAQGGIWMGDPLWGNIAAMEYRAVGFGKRERFRRSAAGDNRGGRPVDEMRELAAEAGYLSPDATVNDFIDLLDNDVRGHKRAYAVADLAEVQAWNAYDDLLDSLAQMGFYFDGKPVLRATTESQRALMGRVIDALDEIDAAEIARLKAKIAEQDAASSRAFQTLNDSEEFAGEVDAILDEVQAKLTKQDALWSEDLSVTVDRAGPLKKRTIDVMRNSFSEFMDNRALDAVGRYMHRMIAEYHLTKAFGRADMKYDLASLKAEADFYGATLTGEERVAFDKKMAADVAMIQTTRDQLRGTHAKGQVGFMAEAARFMSATSYMLQLGDVVTSSISDAFRPVMAHGVAHVLRFGLPRLKEGVKQAVKALEEDDYLRSDRAGVVVERIASSRMMSMMDLEDDYHPNTKATRLSNNLAGLATRISVMDRWNQMTKWVSAGLFMDRLAEMAGRSWDDLKEKDRAFLSINRISQHQWAYIQGQIRAYGSKDRGVWSLNLERWSDRDLAAVVRAAMRKDTDAIIVTPGVGDKIQTLGGMDMTGAVGKMILQYKSFWISGHERIMLRSAQNNDGAAVASGALMMIVMGMLIDEIKAFTGNYGGGGQEYDFEKRWADRNFGTMVMAGLDRSGIVPMWMEANNMLERGLGLPLGYRAAGGLGMLLGAENAGDPSSRWASRNTLGSFLGPSAGVVQDAVQVARDVAGEAQNQAFGMENDGVSNSTITAAKHLIPFQNAPVMRELLNWFLVPAARAALEP